MRYFLGLGSNIEPAPNTIAMIMGLLDLADPVAISRIVETAPVDIYGDGHFYNLCACLTSATPESVLAAQLQQIELRLGRDRDDPERQFKSRPADVDILIAQPADAATVSLAGVPDEPYIRPMLLELIYGLGLSCAEPLPPLPAGLSLQLAGAAIGPAAMQLTRTGARSIQATRLTASGLAAR